MNQPELSAITKERDLFIDYAKAVSILFVVFMHTGISWINNIVYIFMTLFFFTSGYTSHYERNTISHNIKKLFKKLLIPFWVFMLLYGIFEIFRAPYLGYGKADIFLPETIGLVYGTSQKVPMLPSISQKVLEIMSYKPRGSELFLNVMLPTSCHLWFLPAFFTGAVLFILYLNTVGKKRKLLTDGIAVLVLLLLASIESFPNIVQFPYCLGRGFYCCGCMIAGKVFRERNLFTNLFQKVKGLLICLLLLALSVGAYFLGASQSSFARSEYGPYGVFAPVIVYVGGICATVLILFILKFVPKKRIFSAVAYTGQRTMPIYLWHMFFLNIISVLILKITGIQIAQDIWFMAIIPETHSGLIILASVLSLLCCLGIDWLFKTVKGKLKPASSK